MEVLVEEVECFFGGVEVAVDLLFEAMFEDGRENGAWFQATLDKVSSEDEWLWRFFCDGEALGIFSEYPDGFEIVMVGRSHVAFEDICQEVQASCIDSEFPVCSVAIATHYFVCSHMAGDELGDEFVQVVVEPEPMQETEGWFDACQVVSLASQKAVGIAFCGCRFPEVVAEDGERQDKIVEAVVVSFFGHDVQGEEGMVPDIAFGVPFRCLLAADKAFEFREVSNPSAVLQEGEAS